MTLISREVQSPPPNLDPDVARWLWDTMNDHYRDLLNMSEISIKDGCGTEQLACVEANGGLAVNIQDQTTRALDLYFGNLTDSTTLSAQADPEDTTLTLTDTTGFEDGKTVGVFSAEDPDIFYLGVQIGAPVGQVITIDRPIDRTLTVASTVAAVDVNMAVDGSGGNTQIFQVGPVGPGSEQIIDITRIMGVITDGSSMDDGKFGGIDALENGIVFRLNNHVIQNIWGAKTNGDLALLSFDAQYTEKAPAGENGFRFRNTFAGQSKHGVALRLIPGDTLEILIQDDLTGLTNFNMMAQGHFVIGN